MNNFSLHILGSGGALPTIKKRPTAQVVKFYGKNFLIDCGEGTQVQLRKQKISFLKIHHIFISHLHGDHYFGLIGLLSSMHLLGRTKDLHLFCPKPLKDIIDVQLKASHSSFKYNIVYHFLESKQSEIILDEKNLEVYTIPLKHGIYANGFIFKEKPRNRKMKPDKIKFYEIPHYAIPAIKEGGSFITKEGKEIPNDKLTFSQEPSRSYGYCSDTAYREKIIPIIKQVTLLYHEATFLEAERAIAKKTFHSTVIDAANIAKKAEANKLLIGHFSARYLESDYPTFLEEGTSIYNNIEIASEGDVFEL